ncbi:PAAR domain-containing protein [Ralstonia sp.]|uniref:PAAR domain-containing protein n=1 Tax=Ralstonia sp. TaxID=54061 RepID=UPI0031E0EB97
MTDRRCALRHGDTTSTGGVLIATGQGKHRGIQLAVEGDLATCPACRSIGQVVNDCHPAFALKGKQVLVEGARVYCRCANPPTCFASQNSFTIVVNRKGDKDSATFAFTCTNTPLSPRYDLFFHAKHEKTGADLCHVQYRITLEDGRQFLGLTDEKGHTQKVAADTVLTAKIEIPYYDNSATHSAIESEPCGC